VKAKMAPVKIFSNLFNESLWLVADEEEMKVMISKGVKEAIYTVQDIALLRERDELSLKAVQVTKKVFPGSTVVQSRESVLCETQNS
jgi:hypothetical protein